MELKREKRSANCSWKSFSQKIETARPVADRKSAFLNCSQVAFFGIEAKGAVDKNGVCRLKSKLIKARLLLDLIASYWQDMG